MKRRFLKKGFSLIELSLTILVISVVVIGVFPSIKTSLKNTQSTANQKKIEIIYKALGNFVSKNKRLPCPASPLISKDTAGYGDEVATPGTCAGFTAASSTNLIYGMLPTKTLGLDSSMAEDPYGTKFSYVVDRRFTKASADLYAADGFEIIQAMSSSDVAQSVPVITVQKFGSPIMTNALFLIISHGENKFNGWNARNITRNGVSGVAAENSNSGGPTAAGSFAFDAIFDATSSDAAFDDVVFYKNKSELLTDSGAEFFMCSGNEATPPAVGSCSAYSWTTSNLFNGEYGKTTFSNAISNNCCGRKCGKYGKWETPATSPTCGCYLENNRLFGNAQYAGASTTLVQGESVTLGCISGYLPSGTAPSIKCGPGGTLGAAINTGNCLQACAVYKDTAYAGGVLYYTGLSTTVAQAAIVNTDLKCNSLNGYVSGGGTPSMTCQAGGVFGSFSYNCLLPCSSYNGMPLGTKSQVTSTGTRYTHGQDVVLNCQSGKYYQSGAWSGWGTQGRAVCSNGSWQVQNNYTCRDANPCNWSGITANVGKCCHDSNHSCPDCCASQTVSAQNYNQGDVVCFSGDGGGCSGGFHKARTCVTLNSKSCSGDGNASASWSGQSGQTDY